MRHPSFEVDYWRLRSGVESYRANPDTFWIPQEELRNSLKVGDAAKVIVEFEFQEAEGKVSVYAERMWVIVSEVRDGEYIGILDNAFATFEESEEVYLCRGAEIPFRPEHVIDIDNPSADYAEGVLARGPAKRWARDAERTQP